MKILFVMLCLALSLTGCSNTNQDVKNDEPKVFEGAVSIVLSDEMIQVDGEEIGTDLQSAVYLAHDIVYYEEGKDFTYGEGDKEDAHSKEEAEKHSVVHIAQPGTYVLSGKLSAGQIAIDLGDDAEEDPNAVVTLILNGVDISCSVAPAVIFYNVYECSNADEETASAIVDTTNAGANVVIADHTVNTVNGSYVARIYKPESVELNEDKTEVADAKKLHKYDGAFYSKQSMNINGDTEGTGKLMITAENEGLDSELHLTINGGNITIESGNDGINTNEDNVSVTTINGGTVEIVVNGSTGEGDGIDSNGWLVINGGTVITSACGNSADAGIDSDKGIHINGGTVIASGNMLDHISQSEMNYAVFTFAMKQKGNQTYALKDDSGNTVIECTPSNDFSILIVSSEKLAEGTYTLWQGDVQFGGTSGKAMGGFGGGMMQKPDGMEFPEGEMPEKPDGMEFPEGEMPEKPDGMEFPEGEMPEKPDGMEFPEGDMPEMPDGMEFPEGEIPEMPDGMEFPEGQMHERPQGGRQPQDNFNIENSKEFVITGIENYFANVQPLS